MARVIYDGCFLSYELQTFYTEIEFGLSSEVCRGNESVPTEDAFKLVAVKLLKDLADATPKIRATLHLQWQKDKCLTVVSQQKHQEHYTLWHSKPELLQKMLDGSIY
ncbi:hypothetical protein AgCh_033585 [Apium graveolens]